MRPLYLTPCVTALNSLGHPDLSAQGLVIEHLISGGVDGILLMGSMGEFYAFSEQQRQRMVESAVKMVGNRTTLIACTTSMVFDETLRLSRHALKCGVDAVMLISPYYNTHSQEELYKYYARLAENLDGDMYLYNYPERTTHDLEPDTIIRLLSKYNNIVGIKDSSNSASHTIRLIRAIKHTYPSFEVYCGFDQFLPDVYAAGGNGAIGGLSNIAPALTRAWCEAIGRGSTKETYEYSERIIQLSKLYTTGYAFNTVMKTALQLRGISISEQSAFPVQSAAGIVKAIRDILTGAGIEIRE